jgi:hypothetical protein
MIDFSGGITARNTRKIRNTADLFFCPKEEEEKTENQPPA